MFKLDEIMLFNYSKKTYIFNHNEPQMVWATKLWCVIMSVMFGQVEQNFGQP